MMNWLKKRLRAWLAEPEGPVIELDCIIENKCHRMRVVRVHGMKLEVVGTAGQFLIGSHQCVDPKRFWLAWEQRTPTGRYHWPDGTPFKPGGK